MVNIGTQIHNKFHELLLRLNFLSHKNVYD